jgi:hypothetical protein
MPDALEEANMVAGLARGESSAVSQPKRSTADHKRKRREGNQPRKDRSPHSTLLSAAWVAAAVHRPKVPYPTQAREYCFCEVARRGVLVSTPGPLIMVNTFVGFLAGYNVEGGLAWGFLGATIATLCTFVPSVVFHHQRRADHRPDPHHRRVRSLAQRHHDRCRRGGRRARGLRRAPRCLPGWEA